MFFDTPVYIAFLTLVVVIYWRLDRRSQNLFLLAASYFFYGWWDWRFLALILISTVVDFTCARYIARVENPSRRATLLALSLAVNVTFLGFFKYFNFFVDSMVEVLNALGVHDVHVALLRILLPPGISFYTFQAIAYIVDVYRRKLDPADSLVDYALFISFFPHLIAGPIQQPSHLLPQVQKPRAFDSERFFDGLLLILSGLVRKCVIADNCALLADAAFSGKLGPPSLSVLTIGAYAFAVRIYGDFSGYSNIARGSAQLLGFHFMVNFRQPYLARSLQEFWQRWHISLSTWLRDYLFLPTMYASSRRLERWRVRLLSVDEWAYITAAMVTMLLGGLWHGANWTFVVWGGLQGFWLCVELLSKRLRLVRRLRRRSTDSRRSLFSLRSWGARLFVFNLVCVSWVFFRSPSVGEALQMLAGASTFVWRPEFLVAIKFLSFFAIPLFLADLALEYRDEEYLFERSSAWTRIAIALCLLATLVLFSGNDVSAFIYFQF